MFKAFDFVCYPVQDYARAQKFYQEQLGLKFMGGMEGKWGEFDIGGDVFALYAPSAFGGEFHPIKSGGLALRVDDVKAAMAALQAKGVKTMGDPMDTGVCHMGFIEDTEGNGIIVHNRYAPE